jgi:hypothetical protein
MSDNTKARVYIPVAVEDAILRTVKNRMAEKYGGYTVIEARGGWVDEQKELIEENVQVLEVAGGDETFAQSTADWVQLHSDEDTIMWEVVEQTHGFEG